jgi:predicted MFS family arabinose efflux permease
MTAPTATPGTGLSPRSAGRARRHLPVATFQLARTSASRTAWRALHHPDFRWYFAGSLVSNLGTWLQNTAQVLLAYRLTHSVMAVGVVTGAQFSGSLLLGPWAAVVASRIGGRRLLVGTQLLSAGISGLLALLQAAGLLSESFLIAGALGLGLAFTFALPVQTALVPRLVKEADTEAAMAMNSVSYNLGRALAPAMCVLMVMTVGFSWAFALNAASFVVFAGTLARARPLAPGRLPQPAPAQPARARDGVRTALQQRRIMLLLAMVAAVTFADDPVLILGPVLARHLPSAGSDWAGYFLSALGCGTVLGSFRPTQDPRGWDESRTSRRAAKSLLCLVAAIALFAAGISKWVCLLAAFAAGLAALRTGAVTQTQLVRQQPERTASVMALWAIAWAGTKPLASLTDGWVASTHGIWWAAVALGIPAMALGLAEIFLPASWKDRLKHLAGQAGAAAQQSRLWSARNLARSAPAAAGTRETRVTADSLGDEFLLSDQCGLTGSANHCLSGDPALSSTWRLGCASPASRGRRRWRLPSLSSAHRACRAGTGNPSGNPARPCPGPNIKG